MVRISEKIRQAEKEKRQWISFEYFPPRTSTGLVNLYDRIERMIDLGPLFIDITWGAGGTTSDATIEFVKTAQEQFGLETNMHLTCTNMEVEKLEKAIQDAYDAGCRNILALRGDPPRGKTEWTPIDNGFEYAIDLVRFIRNKYGDYFDITVAGFPQGHEASTSKEEEMRYLKEKVDAGANVIISQMFFDIDIFLQWVRDVRAVGITVPIVPGIMPIQNWAHFKRVTDWSKTIVPQKFWDALNPCKDDDDEVRKVGTKLVAEMCTQILESGLGINGLHFYTMNLEKGTRMILKELQVTPSTDLVKPLPFRPSLTRNRRTEEIRPVFWANRSKSYLARTEGWDEFPNGRWGDSRSPAFGEINGYGVRLKYEGDEAIKIWGDPKTFNDIAELFTKFVIGEINALPWCDAPAAAETREISSSLQLINKHGFLTINSQPAVDGVQSADPIFGWGPRNGYVYQKAYLEFFTSPEQFEKLVKCMEVDPAITYHAVNKQGDLRTNTTCDGPNALTWGIFPGKEIVQPTIVEAVSFMAWKDEAYELGNRWAALYPPKSTSHELITSVFDTYFLVNVVHNDYRNADRDKIFKPFLESVGISREHPNPTPPVSSKYLSDIKLTNGIVNGISIQS